jgi:hypothetical protein
MSLENLLGAIGLETSWDIGASGEACAIVVVGNEGRSQRVAVREVEGESGPLLRLSSLIGPSAGLTEVHLRRALALNADLLHGCLAIASGELLITEVMRSDSMTAASLRECITVIGALADKYEKMLFSRDET